MKIWMKLIIILGQLYTMVFVFTCWATKTEMTNPLILLAIPGYLAAFAFFYRYDYLLYQAKLEMQEKTRGSFTFQVVICYIFVMLFGMGLLPKHPLPCAAVLLIVWLAGVIFFWPAANKPPLQTIAA